MVFNELSIRFAWKPIHLYCYDYFFSKQNKLCGAKILFLGMVILLMIYYILWLVLFSGRKTLIVLMCMAVFPVVYFILAEIWLNNIPAIIPTMIFGIVHTIITYRDFIVTR